MMQKKKKPLPPKEKKVQPKVPAEWLYINNNAVNLESIYDFLKDDSRWVTEYWKEADILEIAIPGAGSVDIEAMEPTVAAVTIRPEDYEKARQVMEYVGAQTGGYFCADNDDFSPQI